MGAEVYKGTVTFKQEETSGHEPQAMLDTKTDKQTD
jgi:hypothetical protein